MNEVRRFTRTREEIDNHGHPYEVEELCVPASDFDALAARVQAVERERDEIAARWKEDFELRCSLEQQVSLLREALQHINYSRSQWIIGKITNDEYFNCIADGLREGEV